MQWVFYIQIQKGEIALKRLQWVVLKSKPRLNKFVTSTDCMKYAAGASNR